MKNRELIYGTLLGDAWIYKEKRGSYLFAFCQANEEYARWKAKLLDYDFREYKIKRFDKRTKKTYSNLTVHIKLSHEEKEELHSIFYQPKKIISEDILSLLTNKAICLWYLDDGNLYYNGNICHIQLSVDGFTLDERELAIQYFKKKFKLNFKHTSKSIRLTSKKDCETFMSIVDKYIPDCMAHKRLSKAIEKYKKKKYG